MTTGFITVKEAASKIQISRTTFYRLVRAGEISVFKVGARSTRIPQAELERLIARYTIPRKPDAA
jgi:excisionase family DNA binding protein